MCVHMLVSVLCVVVCVCVCLCVTCVLSVCHCSEYLWICFGISLGSPLVHRIMHYRRQQINVLNVAIELHYLLVTSTFWYLLKYLLPLNLNCSVIGSLTSRKQRHRGVLKRNVQSTWSYRFGYDCGYVCPFWKSVQCNATTKNVNWRQNAAAEKVKKEAIQERIKKKLLEKSVEKQTKNEACVKRICPVGHIV